MLSGTCAVFALSVSESSVNTFKTYSLVLSYSVLIVLGMFFLCVCSFLWFMEFLGTLYSLMRFEKELYIIF